MITDDDRAVGFEFYDVVPHSQDDYTKRVAEYRESIEKSWRESSDALARKADARIGELSKENERLMGVANQYRARVGQLESQLERVTATPVVLPQPEVVCILCDTIALLSGIVKEKHSGPG